VSSNSGGAGGEGGSANGYFAGVFTFGGGGDGGSGGSIRNAGTLNLYACTITRNQGGPGGSGGSGRTIVDAGSGVHIIFGNGGSGGSGGGVLNLTNGAAAILRNTLIALNYAGGGGLGGTNNFNQQTGPVGATGVGADLDGDFTSHGFNLVGQGDSSTDLTNGSNGDLLGTSAAPLNPLLGPLQDNGGFTPTHALLAGSPALDQGISSGLATDQRGRPRPHDYASIPNAPGGDGSDIGAFESDAPLLIIQHLANRAVLSWDTNSPACTLQAATSLASPSDWLSVTDAPAIAAGQYHLTNTPAIGNKFFRLRGN
jgi:hypothetical protein